jgi:hypothetical protein
MENVRIQRNKDLNQRYLMFSNIEFNIIFEKQFVLKKFQFKIKYFSFIYIVLEYFVNLHHLLELRRSKYLRTNL